MSLIRCTSNPEGLYMFVDSDDMLNINCTKTDICTTNYPFDDETFESFWKIPYFSFVKLVNKERKSHWLEQYEEDGITLKKKVSYYEDTGEELPDSYWRDFDAMFNEKRETVDLYELKYEDYYVRMYQVTWEHITSSVGTIEEEKNDLEKK